jgi:hypothetical protein
MKQQIHASALNLAYLPQFSFDRSVVVVASLCGCRKREGRSMGIQPQIREAQLQIREVLGYPLVILEILKEL